MSSVCRWVRVGWDGMGWVGWVGGVLVYVCFFGREGGGLLHWSLLLPITWAAEYVILVGMGWVGGWVKVGLARLRG